VTVILADCRSEMREHGPYDMILADPPYGDTSLAWDKRVKGWQQVAADTVKPTGSMWVFGSFRYFLAEHHLFEAAGWRLAQEVVWEKHNGSSFHADRFKRVHEIAAHYYLAATPWEQIYNDVQTTADATPRTVRRKQRPAHTGHIEASAYVSEDGGPRIMRSVIPMRSCHGHAIHPTEKPVGLLSILIRTSCPEGGLVGDFFAGSGAGGEAAYHSGRRYIGCEIDPAYHASATARLAGQLFGAAA
jgi:site-specific DNA-methyltransferase (adenine-specific)